MAKLSANGTEIARLRKTRDEESNGQLWRYVTELSFRSNRWILRKTKVKGPWSNSPGHWTRWRRLKEGVDIREQSEKLANSSDYEIV